MFLLTRNFMIRSILMGLVAGMRSMMPIAVVSWAAGRNSRSSHTGLPSILSSPGVSKVTLALAAAELLDDKMRSAPDRTIAPGSFARVVTGAIAGAAAAPSRDRRLDAVRGATVAVGTAYLTLALRKQAIHKGRAASTGLIEDAVALGIHFGLPTPRNRQSLSNSTAAQIVFVPEPSTRPAI
jgi:uncharacterized membrane protein